MMKTYPEIPKVCNVIKVFNILFITEVPQDVNIPIGTFITSKNVMIWYNNNLLTVPNL